MLRYPSTMAICWRCSLEAFAQVLDQFNEIECYSGTAVGMNLHKFWISFAESSVMMTSERHFGQPDDVKLAPERRSQQPLWRQVSPGTTLWVTWRRQVGPRKALRPSDSVKLALKRRCGRTWQLVQGRPRP